MEIEKTPLEGILILHPRVFPDNRGFFFESYNAEKFRALGLRIDWVQDNHSRSQRNTLRGLHFQKGKGQAKLVRCTLGSVWDVAVDIRPDSPQFGQWMAERLSRDNHRQLYIPAGFAHGFCVLSEHADVWYKTTDIYRRPAPPPGASARPHEAPPAPNPPLVPMLAKDPPARPPTPPPQPAGPRPPAAPPARCAGPA